jgi:outer membrane biogenesis lipoprotein LolB
MRKLLGCFLILTLSACASLKPVRNPDDVNDRVKFSMDARFSVNYVEDTKNKNLTGKMQWEESNRATDVVLSSPIGSAMASLHLTNNEAVLKTSSGEMYVEKTAEELLYRMLGYELPLSDLRKMIGSKDVPLPDGAKFNEWSAQVDQRFENPNLAKKLTITRQKPTPLTMILFIDERSDFQSHD